MERERYQLMIGLGEGAEGKRLRGVFDRVAERMGRPVTVWAREILLTAVGESSSTIDPIVEVFFGGKQTQINLRAVSGMRKGLGFENSTDSVSVLIEGQWLEMGCSTSDGLLERWKRVHRSGLALG